MSYEFYGKTEQEAIKKAMRDLELKEGEFDVEILDKERVGFLFKKEMIKIRVSPHVKEVKKGGFEIQIGDEICDKILEFVKEMLIKMGYTVNLTIELKEEGYVKISIETDSPNILIGREGKNLDSLQLLTNVYTSRLIGETGAFNRVILDIGDYRERFKSRFINLAINSFHKVKRTRRSILLPSMNPFERRIIHTTLNRYSDIKTESEGDGNIKRIRVSYVRNNRFGSNNFRSYQKRDLGFKK
ncbi:RNA-binding cell elongation regulator Jag/EloR [Borreliella afzelii]|uniref:RNA-binding cell elongation regulator Jag/EloR n=1 Tax=Borreliella afzelii TaxID=29518 RepID=UPI00016B3C77|nr:RNA-binding cell elongation regulator Jag/EloR [Borreliella afzelii]AFU74736.1 spoIIIJ-associtated protein [Borreliella afzelii HLJ01]AJY72426.1 R3H domain protein [Borreliella afzelii K78]EEC21158.1 spoiiij-associtated protein [Borreliella afzelii ACA-1]AIK18740.1 Jag protein [Borreliella afzelii Tom3107]APJ08678.1 Jag protein [Borreliella afzelii]